jgi:CheY-like chemotaxis protein
MSFLIVDPKESSRNAVAAMVSWVDRRHRIDFADSGSRALVVALKRRPRVVFIDPELPDIAGEELCYQLHQRFQRLACIALTNSERVLGTFDDQIRNPPSRIEVLNAIEKSKRCQQKNKNECVIKEVRRPIFFENSAPSVLVYLSIFNESLRFAVPVPLAATLGDVLKQIGKAGLKQCVVMRNGKTIDLSPDMAVQEHDQLILQV